MALFECVICLVEVRVRETPESRGVESVVMICVSERERERVSEASGKGWWLMVVRETNTTRTLSPSPYHAAFDA